MAYAFDKEVDEEGLDRMASADVCGLLVRKYETP